MLECSHVSRLNTDVRWLTSCIVRFNFRKSYRMNRIIRLKWRGMKGVLEKEIWYFASRKIGFSAGSIQWKKYGRERVPASDGSLGGRRCGCPTPTPHFALTLPLLPLMLGRNLILRGWKEVCCMLRTHFALIQMPAHHKTLFYPDSFTGDILGWHGIAKENYVKGKMWWGRMSDTWTLFYNMRIKVFWELLKFGSGIDTDKSRRNLIVVSQGQILGGMGI